MTGVPGVGKTTVCSMLAAQYPGRYCHVSFGKLILEALESGERALSYSGLRREVSKFVTPAVIERATRLLEERARSAEPTIWTVVDSHAVSQDWYGYRVTADGPRYFAVIRYKAIVNLFANAGAVLNRTVLDRAGRHALSEKELELHSGLQAAVSICYGSLSECPVFFVDAGGDIKAVVERVDAVLKGCEGESIPVP
ncbi:MAG: ATP-binding protein [Actinomycetota bacterium]